MPKLVVTIAMVAAVLVFFLPGDAWAPNVAPVVCNLQGMAGSTPLNLNVASPAIVVDPATGQIYLNYSGTETNSGDEVAGQIIIRNNLGAITYNEKDIVLSSTRPISRTARATVSSFNPFQASGSGLDLSAAGPSTFPFFITGGTCNKAMMLDP